MTQDSAVIVERLRKREPFVNDSISLKPRLINPDGPEAAAHIEAQAVELEKMREALGESASCLAIFINNIGLPRKDGSARCGLILSREQVQHILEANNAARAALGAKP